MHVTSSLMIYCWLNERWQIIWKRSGRLRRIGMVDLLERATEEQQWVFRELFLKGRKKEELALELSRESDYVDKLLRESLIILRTQIV